jgi:hypothetical protein
MSVEDSSFLLEKYTHPQNRISSRTNDLLDVIYFNKSIIPVGRGVILDASLHCELF